MPRLSALLTASFALSAVGCISLFALFQPEHQPFLQAVLYSSALIVAPAWTALAAISLWRYGQRAQWVLAGAPFALLPAGVVVLLTWICFHGC